MYFKIIGEIESIETIAISERMNGNSTFSQWSTLKATRKIGKKKWLIVIYKEVSKRDGFVITAYFLNTKPKGKVIWRQ